MSKVLIRRVERHSEIASGERVLEAICVVPLGLGSETAAEVPTGDGTAASLPGWHMEDERFEEWARTHGAGADPRGEASRWPALKRGILALTDRRLLLFDAGDWVTRPRSIRVEYALDRVADISDETGMGAFRISFEDGSSVVTDSVRGGPRKSLIDALAVARQT